MRDTTKKTYGVLAEFGSPGELLAAAEKIRRAGFTDFDCHSPFPIHGMDAAMGEKRSKLGWIVAFFAFVGFAGAIVLQGWTSAIAYPLRVAGKIYFSYQAFFPVTFSLTVLLSAFASVFGMIGLIKQRYNHPVFYSDRFAKATDDGFFVSVMADDPKFDPKATRDFLASIGGTNVELLEGE